MPRLVSDAAKEGLFAQETGLVFVECLTVRKTVDGVQEVKYRICNNTEDISSRGNTFTAIGFDANLPEETQTAFGTLEITLNNAERWLTPLMRNESGDLDIIYELCSATDLTASPKEFDSVEQTLAPMQIKTTEIREDYVKITCSHRRWLEQAWPQMRFTPNHFPGLF